jgi:cell division protein FtsQ
MIGLNPLREFWHAPRTMNLVSWMLFAAGVGFVLMSLGFWLANQRYFGLRTVLVDAPQAGLTQIQEADIRDVLGEQISGTALTLDLQPLQTGLARHPWVRQVSIRRVWPNRLLIRLEEHEAIGIWSDGRLVNRFGELFVGETQAAIEHAKTHLGCQMPKLQGPVGTVSRVMARARTAHQLASASGQQIKSVTLTEQFAWQLELGQGHRILLGREGLSTDWQTRLTALLDSLAWLNTRVLKDQPASTLSFDLRYANGYAFSPLQPSTDDGQRAPAAPSQPSCLIYLEEGKRYAT